MSRALVLCYHAVSERWESQFAVSPEVLDGQLRSLLKRGYRGATFTEAVTAPPHRRTLAVTFDDGLRSVAAAAGPILERLGLPGTAFVCSDYVGQDRPLGTAFDSWLGTPYESELLPMSWDDLASLQADGWEIGSHTASHADLTTLNDDALNDELQRSRADITAALTAPCTSLAYPFGAHDERVVQAAGIAGYTAAGTTEGGLRSATPQQAPRVVVYRHDTTWRFTSKTVTLGRALADAPGFQAARRARARMRRSAGSTPDQLR